MPDTYVEVTHTSWFTRIRKSFGGIVAGFLLILAAIAALFWNEGRAVTMQRALEEGAGLVQTIDAGRVDPQFDGKLVHFTADLQPQGTPGDPLFKTIVAPAGSLRLTRKVEMYQWVENKKTKTQKKLGGGEETVTTYSYEKIWSERAVDSSSFKHPSGHMNPPKSLASETAHADSTKAGAITITSPSVFALGKDEPLALSEADGRTVKLAVGTGRPVHVQGGTVLLGFEPTAPLVGDLRITFSSASVERVSAVGKMVGDELGSFTTSNGTNLFMVREGEATAAQMFKAAEDANTTMTWIIRIGGLLAMLAGFRLVFGVIGVLGDVVPFIGDVMRFATGLVSFALTAVIGPTVIGIAWLYYRPVVGLSIIGVGLILAVGFLMLGKMRARDRAAAAGTA
ncbi:MAG: hypothetical protein C0606_04550 [Hyphomicrobiales bacterium]|nr:MAG: hypothetical protein C0606_04550 [Hyphomicrobiales bacterium]